MSPVPIYETIFTDLHEQIHSGALAPRERLPSETELAAQYGVSRMTVRQAMDLLEAQHLVLKRRGAGTFVTSPRPTFRRMNRLRPFQEEAGVDEPAVTTVMKLKSSSRPPAVVREKLELTPEQEAIRIVRVRVVNGEPAAIQDSWLPFALAPDLVREDLIGSSLYRTLAERFNVHLRWAEQEITASAATAEQAEWLSIKRGSPLIATTRIAYQDGGAPAEYSRGWTRPQFPLLVRLDA